ncbi:MAG: amidohydrolase [Paracoccaceae bacterium]
MTPDLILTGGRIRTMDPTRLWAEALAIRGGRILALGSDADIRALAGPGTRLTHAGGRLVLPGIQDAHIHLMDGGVDLVTAAPLWDARSVAELQAAVRAHARATAFPLVVGTGWQFGTFTEANLTREVVDAAVSDRPAILYDSSYHSAVFNSAACRIAGIVAGRQDPPKGRIVRDAAGEPTGMLHEEEVIAGYAALPQWDDATRLTGLRAAQALAHRHGITGILDPRVLPAHLAAYGALAREGGLTLHACGAGLVRPGEDPAQAVERLSDWRAGAQGLALHSAKFFLDGVIESRTAAMLAPYADAAGGNAPLLFDPAEIAPLFTALDAARFQIHSHVIGDGAVRAALDGIEAAREANGAWPALHQLAHLQVVDPADIPRIAALGAMANIQPLWARLDPDIPDDWLDLVGAARRANVYPFRRILDTGAPWCLSSDWAVSTLNPFPIIETAVTRAPGRHERPRPPFLPAEAISVEEAVAGYTTGAAAACWRAGSTGMLRPGYAADLIVLDRDILSGPADQIGGTEVLLTLFAGREVHRAGGFGG